MQEETRKPRISHRQALKLGRLLAMEYRPTELAREIGCHRSTIYDCYIPNGAPHRRDEKGHLWIVGTEFAAWARATIQRRKLEMRKGQAFCMRCKRIVTMQGPISEREVKSALLLHGTCPQCFGDVVRFESPEGGVG